MVRMCRSSLCVQFMVSVPIASLRLSSLTNFYLLLWPMASPSSSWVIGKMKHVILLWLSSQPMVQFIAWMTLSCTPWPRLVLVDSTVSTMASVADNFLLKLLTMLRELVITWRFDTTSLTGAPHKASKDPVAAVLFVMRNKQPNASKLRPFLWLLLRPFDNRNPDDMWTALFSFAEEALCLESVGAPRHLQWQPSLRPRDSRKAAAASEPLPLRRLRRLQRRLRHLLHTPADLQLASNVLRDVRSLSNDFPDLASIDLVNLNSVDSSSYTCNARQGRRR